jgi:peptide/nickel transport system substrate-binding protein
VRLTRKMTAGLLVFLSAAVGCHPTAGDCSGCGTVVVAAIGEPTSLVPPLVYETVGRDISDQVFERLANLAPGASPIDPAAYRPGLARRWARVDSLTWRFTLRPGAQWHDGRPVTASDVVFSFNAFTDSAIDAPARSYLAGRVRATAEDSTTVRISFTRSSPEQLYDATYHVRILPRHVWEGIPFRRWAADTAVGHLIGSGPYRVQEWRRGQFLTLVADTMRGQGFPLPAVGRAVWRFAADPDAALNLILSHEADLMETAGAPDRVQRIRDDSTFRVVTYPAALYGFLAFRVADASSRPHPVLGNREIRRALTEAVDRSTLSRALFGPEAKVPPGPMSQLLWIWDDRIKALPFDSIRARGTLKGLKAGAGTRPIDILVPTTSSTRKQLALAIQEAWRKVGVPATVTLVEFPVFQERLAQGRFDSYIGAYLDEPSPRGLADQWSRSGWEALNYGRYANPVFDSLLASASREANVVTARRRWSEAMDTLNADAPAIFLYAPAHAAVIHRRLADVRLDPYSWISGLSEWRVGGESRKYSLK